MNAAASSPRKSISKPSSVDISAGGAGVGDAHPTNRPKMSAKMNQRHLLTAVLRGILSSRQI
jgi:hypothetical protein